MFQDSSNQSMKRWDFVLLSLIFRTLYAFYKFLALIVTKTLVATYGAARPKTLLARHCWSMFAIHDVERMVDLDLAWWPYEVQNAVSKFLNERHFACRAFEWGAGASTIWLWSRNCSCISVEHDKVFYEKLYLIKARLKAQFELVLKPCVAFEDGKSAILSGKSGFEGRDFSDYVDTIESYGAFDLIIIDGRARAQCLEKAMYHLKDDGLILFDNSDRERYRPALEKLAPYKKTIHGLTPASPWPTSSTLIAKEKGVLDALFE